MDSAFGFSDGGLLIGLGADIGKKVSSDFANRITSDTNTSPDRIKYFGDLFLLLILTPPRSCPHLNSDGEIVLIHIQV